MYNLNSYLLAYIICFNLQLVILNELTSIASELRRNVPEYPTEQRNTASLFYVFSIVLIINSPPSI